MTQMKGQLNHQNYNYQPRIPMPHNTEASAPKHHPVVTILGSALMLVFLVQMIFPGALQWPVGKTNEGLAGISTAPTSTPATPLHYEGEVVTVVDTGDYFNSAAFGQSSSRTILVREKDVEYMVDKAELTTPLLQTTRKLVKVIKDGKINFAPFKSDGFYADYFYKHNYSFDYNAYGGDIKPGKKTELITPHPPQPHSSLTR